MGRTGGNGESDPAALSHPLFVHLEQGRALAEGRGPPAGAHRPDHRVRGPATRAA